MGYTNDRSPTSTTADLRRQAEQLLCLKGAEAVAHYSESEAQRLLHELEVHRIELEMQNAELLRAREEVETVLETYTDLYDFAPIGYLTLDRDKVIRSVNLSGASLLGVERSQLNGRRFEAFLASDSRPVFSAFLEKILVSSVKEGCTVALQTSGPFLRFAQIEGVAAASGQEYRLALIDISERKRAEEEARQAKEAVETSNRKRAVAEESAKVKSQFLANMSHELRTPMTGILGMLQLALDEELAPDLRGYLESSLHSAQSLLRILNDILDMAKIEAGKYTLEQEPFALRQCISEVGDLISSEVRRKGLAFSLLVDDQVPEKVVGDQLRLRQVLLNLIGNAVKFTDKGGVEVRVTAAGTTSRGPRVFSFSVKDSGIGIPADKQELLFKAFSQGDVSHSRIYGGTGLGLAITLEILTLMGGSISFESALGKGSTFTFCVPLGVPGEERSADAAEPPRSVETVNAVTTSARIPHLLVVEDDPITRNVLKLMLKRFNYELDFAEDGLKAVELWEQGGYDLVLMDIQMPGLNGFEATQIIREKEQKREGGGHTPIIAMTAHAYKEDEDRCLAYGMDAYVSKPINFRSCNEVIRRVLDKAGTFPRTV